MKTAVCITTCYQGTTFFREGREYEVDETDPFIQKYFGLDPPKKATPVKEPEDDDAKDQKRGKK